jgi:hypothetical protein
LRHPPARGAIELKARGIALSLADIYCSIPMIND